MTFFLNITQKVIDVYPKVTTCSFKVDMARNLCGCLFRTLTKYALSHHRAVTVLTTSSLLKDSSRQPAAVVRGRNDREVLWWKTCRWNSSTHKAQVTNDFDIFGIFNCYLFGRNFVLFTDFLLVSCVTADLCHTARTTTLWAPPHVCFQIQKAAVCSVLQRCVQRCLNRSCKILPPFHMRKTGTHGCS